MYTLGRNRIWYSSGTCNNKIVELDILTPALKRSNRIEMTNFEDVFYTDVVFTVTGSHVIRVFEDSIVKHQDVLVVGHSSLILYP